MLNLLFASLFIGVSLAVTLDGPCPTNIPVVTNFQLERYMGKWYEQRRYEAFFEKKGECVTANYSMNPDGTVKMNNTMINLESKKSNERIGSAKLSYPEKRPLEGMLNVTYNQNDPNVVNYKIVCTDYTNYSLVWNCQKGADNRREENLWLLSRTPQLNPVPEKVKDLLNQYFKTELLHYTNQDINTCKRTVA